MRTLLAFTVATALSTSVFADNMSPDNETKAMQGKMNDEQSVNNVLQNKKLQRLHRNMTHFGLSEKGMEARRKMIITEEGQAYHRALEKKGKMPQD